MPPVMGAKRSPYGVVWAVDAATIEKACILRGWTRQQLSASANVDPDTLSHLLAGRRRPHLSTLRAICEALGLSFDEVVVFT